MRPRSIGLACLVVMVGVCLSGCLCSYEAAPSAKPTALETSGSVTLNIEFDTAKSDIKPMYNDEIKQVADFMKAHPEAKVMIQGHTDNVGSEASNIALSQARANSVKDYLVEKFGIAGDRLQAMGYGPNKPIATNATAEGRQKNRRVEAVVEKMAK